MTARTAAILPATAQLLPPDARRAWFWLVLLCPHCSAFHLARSRTADEASGTRRVACGRQVLVIVAERGVSESARGLVDAPR